MRSFGRYELIRRIAVGGMAEIFLARSACLDGFEKVLVIKRIRADLSRNQKFYSMFIDEARISITLNHPNIVQVFDFGKIEDCYYLCMELVTGCDIGSVLELKSVRGKGIDAGLALLIAENTCLGLDYAHNHCNAQGEPLGVIHRDISPANILLSFHGTVKVTDFGIAKAKNRTTQTTPGMVIGKLSYMSPEQACAQPLDRRTDVYSTGIVLWEMLTGRPAFGATIDDEFYERVQYARIAPVSLVRAGLPPGIDDVVHGALALSPGDRYPTARDFGEAIRRFRVQHYPESSQYALQAFLEQHRGELLEIHEEIYEGEYGTQAVQRPGAREVGLPDTDLNDAVAPRSQGAPRAFVLDAHLSPKLVQTIEDFRRRPSLWTLLEMGRICRQDGNSQAADVFFRAAAVKFAQAGLLAPALLCCKARLELRSFTELRDEFTRLPLLHGAPNDEAHAAIFVGGGAVEALLKEVLSDIRPMAGQPGAGTPLLSYLGGDGFAEFVEAARVRHFEEGQVVVAEGDRGSTMYLIGEGRVLVYATGAEGQRIYLSSLTSGDFFGENGFFTGAPRSATVEALYGLNVFEIDQALYDRVMQRNPQASQILLRFYKERIVETVLAKSPVFGRLPSDDRRRLVAEFKLKVFNSGEQVIREGDLNQQIYLIKSGQAEVYTEKGGPVTTLSTIGPETVFGEVAVLRNIARTASVRATQKLETLELSGDVFLRVLSNKPDIKQKILDVVAQRARENIDKVMGPSPFARNLNT